MGITVMADVSPPRNPWKGTSLVLRCGSEPLALLQRKHALWAIACLCHDWNTPAATATIAKKRCQVLQAALQGALTGPLCNRGGRVGQTRFFASSLLPALGHVASSCFAEAGGSGGRVLHRRGCLCSWSLGQRTWGYKFRKRWGLRIGRMRIEPEVPLEEVQDKSAGSHDNVTLPREQKRFAVFCSGGFLCCPPTSWANYVAKISGWVRDVDTRPLEAAIFYRWCNEALAAGQAHGRAALVVNMWSKRSARACSREARRVLTVEWAGWAGHHWASLGASHAFYLGGWRKTNVFSFAKDFYDRG